MSGNGFVMGDFNGPDTLHLNYEDIHIVKHMCKSNGIKNIVVKKDTVISVEYLAEELDKLIEDKEASDS